VIGGALPSATPADTLAAGPDQRGLPPSASTGLVTGGQGARTVALAAARHRVRADAGWDVERDGLARSYDAGSGAREAGDDR
jgi:hypothetical protein